METSLENYYENQYTKEQIHHCVSITAKIHDVSVDQVYTELSQTVLGRNFEDPTQIKVGDVGTYTKGGRYGRTYWDGFIVTKILSLGKKIEVEFDNPIRVGKEEMEQIDNPDGFGWINFIPEKNKFRVLEYRKPGRWMFKGVTAKDTFGSISFGEKKTEIEQGYF